MKALVKHKSGPGEDTIALMDVPEPVPGNDEIKVKVLACGICGTDIHIMLDEYVNYPPVILGHEFIGVVCGKGPDVAGFEIGDTVVSLTAVKTCGKCRYCRQDLRMLCDQRKSIGCIINGAMAEYIVIPADTAFKVPPGIEDMDSLVISEPATCVVRAVIEKSAVKAGDVVLVSGPGTIGQLAAQTARIQGAYVVVSGLPCDRERLQLAKKLGADAIAESEDELREILRQAAPYGADVALECAGAESSARTCINMLRKTGTYTQIGLFGKEVRVNMDTIVYKEITVTSSIATERTSWETYLRLIQNNKYNLAPLVSQRLPLERWAEGFRLVRENKGYKTVLVP